MTYGNLKNLVRALLIGDNTLTKNEEEALVLLDYAYDRIANETDAMKLFTDDPDGVKILRQGPGRQYVRRPFLPTQDEDVLDIDHELCFVAARFMSSFISREKMNFHEGEAQKLIRLYNAKVTTYFETLEQYGDLEEYDQYDQFGKRRI